MVHFFRREAGTDFRSDDAILLHTAEKDGVVGGHPFGVE